MGEVQLLSTWASPFVIRVKVALALKQIPYQTIEQDLQNKSELLLSSNPVHKKVPVLIHNEKPICESMIIVQYIDESWPGDEFRPGFFPKDPYARAMARFWADFVVNKFADSVRKIMLSSGEEKERAQTDFKENAKILDEALSETEGPFFGGNTLNYTDIILSPYVAWKPVVVDVFGLQDFSEEECPYLHKWFVAMADQPSVKAVLPHPQKLIDLVKVRYSK